MGKLSPGRVRTYLPYPWFSERGVTSAQGRSEVCRVAKAFWEFVDHCFSTGGPGTCVEPQGVCGSTSQMSTEVEGERLRNC